MCLNTSHALLPHHMGPNWGNAPIVCDHVGLPACTLLLARWPRAIRIVAFCTVFRRVRVGGGVASHDAPAWPSRHTCVRSRTFLAATSVAGSRCSHSLASVQALRCCVPAMGRWEATGAAYAHGYALHWSDIGLRRLDWLWPRRQSDRHMWSSPSTSTMCAASGPTGGTGGPR